MNASSYAKTILLVDDNEDERFLLLKAFKQNGITSPIHALGSGEEAIKYLMGEGKYGDRSTYAYPSFILTDLKMAHGDGLDVLFHIKSNPEFAVIPTVIMSSSNDPDDIKKCYMLGASSYHLKPSSYAALKRLLGILHGYWMECLIPEIDFQGRQLTTGSTGKIGERFEQLVRTKMPQQRAKKQ